jgi:hypothetical protein
MKCASEDGELGRSSSLKVKKHTARASLWDDPKPSVKIAKKSVVFSALFVAASSSRRP